MIRITAPDLPHVKFAFTALKSNAFCEGSSLRRYSAAGGVPTSVLDSFKPYLHERLADGSGPVFAMRSAVPRLRRVVGCAGGGLRTFGVTRAYL